MSAQPTDADKPIPVANRKMSATDWLVDLVIFAGVLGFGLLQLTLSVNLLIPDDFTRRLLGIRIVSPTDMAIVATFIMSLPVITRRRFPTMSFAVATALWIAFEWALSAPMLSLVGVLVTLFTLAYTNDKAHAMVGGLVALAAVFAVPLAGTSSTLTALLMLQNAALIIAVCFAGYSLRTSSRLAESAKARAEEQLRAQEAESSRRLEEERVAIAREVHDITAHSISAVSVQAALAERLIGSDPEGARAAIVHIREVSKTALEELREVVSVLRSGDAANTQPLQGIAEMPELVGYLEQAGISCKYHEHIADDAHVPAYVGTALYSIAREAVTNVVRHSGASKAKLDLGVDDGLAEVSVTDDGRGVGEGPWSGHGIEGMRERAKALGGTFDIRRLPEGGTIVVARIPVAQGGAA